jgi:OOP family OmpA-OmpF porin
MKIMHLILLYFVLQNILAQQINHSSISLNIGGHDGMHPTIHHTRIYQFTHYETAYRYMLNNRVGMKFDVGYDNFNFTDGHPNTRALRFSFQPVFNLSDVFHFNDFSERLGLQVHIGAGYAAMWNKDLKSGPAELFAAQEGSVDEILQGIIGFTPLFKISEKLSLQADISFMGNIRQNNGFDFEALPIQGGGFSAYYAAATIGMNYYFGKAPTHADWAYSPRLNASDLNKIIELDKQIVELKNQMSQIDTVIVRTETRVEFYKGDTIWEQNKNYLVLEEAGVYEVLFEKSSVRINPVYHQSLNKLIKLMKDNPNLKISLTGHADSDGLDAVNNKLSEERAQAVFDYLVTNGISKERLEIGFKGETQTKYPGKTVEVDAANRRVSFKIIP